MRSSLTRIVGTTVVVAAAALAPAPAAAAPPCPGASPAVPVAHLPGVVIEGAAVDGAGRLYVTDLLGSRVLRVDHPGAAPVTVATVPGGAGGLAWAPDGALLVGTGAAAGAAVGDVVRPAGIARVDTATGAATTFATGLSAANGLAAAADGTVYATNDFGTLIGRVTADGRVDPAWARLPSANGAALSADGRWLHVARTFVNPGVSRISTADPGHIEDLLTLGGPEALAAPDGLVLDSHDRPVVPTDVAGEVWRLDGPGRHCALTAGLPASSVLTYGRGGGGFPAGRLYRAGFDGVVYEVPAGFDPGA